MAGTVISESDLEAILGAADSLADVETLEQLRRRAVEIVAELVQATMVAWNEVDLAGRQIDAVISPPLDRFTARSDERLRSSSTSSTTPCSPTIGAPATGVRTRSPTS